MPHLSEDDWRVVLELSDSAAELPPPARLVFLQNAGATHQVIEQVLTLLAKFGPESETPNRIGASIGRFTVTDYCGSGGVGDVYKAKDTELQRAVALKFLRPSSLEQMGAVERFAREARTASALNHPNIVTVHEVIRSGEELAIVMEFVDGTPLRTISGSPLPLPQVLAIGQQIARALAAAHAQGIVHRDIKPENVILRRDGSLKVLDFGLATSLSLRGQGEGAISPSHLFAGTWRYMSPEQSRGEPVTIATDVFSLGLVLYELASGRLPQIDESSPPTLSGETASSFFASRRASATFAVLRKPRKTVALPGAPRQGLVNSLFASRRASATFALLNSMLAESPDERPTAAAVAQRLAELEVQLAPDRKRRLSAPLVLAAGALTLASLVALAFFALRTRPPSSFFPVPISVEPGYKWSPTFSPDGNEIAYAWDRSPAPRQIYLQSINTQTGSASPPARLTSASVWEDLPAWSPDGKTIAYQRMTPSGWMIILRDVTNGHERILSSFSGRSINWMPDGKWLLTSIGSSSTYAIALISVQTGEKRMLTAFQQNVNDATPESTPDGRSVTFTRYFGDTGGELFNLRLDRGGSLTGRPTVLEWAQFRPSKVSNPVYRGNGHDLLFIAVTHGLRRIWRSHFGEAPTLVNGLGDSIDGLKVARTGDRFAYIKNLDDTNIWKVQLYPTSASQERTSRVISSSRFDQRPALSPDGSRVAFESDRSGYMEIWLAKIATGETWPLTDLKSVSGSPRWSPDGQWITFDSRIGRTPTIFKISSRGGQPQRLTFDDSSSDILPVFSADGRFIFFCSNRTARFQIWQMPTGGGIATRQTDGDGSAPEVSADGRFLYFLDDMYRSSHLWRKDLKSGQIKLVENSVDFRCFAVGKRTLYFVQRDGIFAKTESGHTLRFSALPPNIVGGVSLSPDEKTLYYAELDGSGNDLMLVDRFQ